MKQPKTNYEIYKSIRRDWNGIDPVTKVEKNKKKYSRKVKHKGKCDE